MDGIPYADIVILALIAGFILLRLRSVLGQKSEGEKPQFFKRDDSLRPAEKESVVQLTGKALKGRPEEDADLYLQQQGDNAIARTLTDMKKIDAQFSATSFLSGARMAYEMVFDAFAKGDKKTLEMLLDKPIYDTFVREIDARDKASEKTESTLVSVKPKDISEAVLTGTKARLSVKFESEQVSITKDLNGNIIEGHPSITHLMDDDWVFERDLTSKSPNWKIIET